MWSKPLLVSIRMEEICGCPAIQATWIMSPSNHDDVPYNINSTQDVSLSSISPAPKLFPEKLNTLTDGLPKQIPHNLPNVNSITVFPYLLKPDKILNFSFRKDANNHSAKMAVYPLGHSKSENTHKFNWSAFLKDV